ncbi:SPFH domain-containing protein [Streptomyces sp. NPDC056178]|uniref:SPFH domain-containing protein n=1 Tax=Streptomyces sp. NPDC056178 TaxID=3345735 RepID=UPI0035D6090B
MGSTVSDSSGTPENGRGRQEEQGVDGEPGTAPVPGAGGGPDTAPGAEAAFDRAAGAGPGPGSAPDAESGAGPDSVVDLVLDLVPRKSEDSATLGAASAAVSVPAMGSAPVPAVGPAHVPAAGSAPVRAMGTAPVPAVGPAHVPAVASAGAAVEDSVPGPAPVPALAGHRTGPGSDTPFPSPSSRHRAAADAVFGSLPVSGGDGAERSGGSPWGAGRHHAVIAGERTASIPVHLLFREDSAHADAAAPPAGVRPGEADGGGPAVRVRRPPAPRGPRVRPSTRPAPVGDPRLAERPGPVLPGWVALLAGLAGIAAGFTVLWWGGVLPAAVPDRLGIGSRPYHGIGLGAWAALAALVTVVLFALGGLSRGRVGYAWVLTLFGEYRGSVRRTGLMWISPLLLRRRVDVRLRHWRSEPLPSVDADGTALRVVVLVVWRIRDTVRATLGVADHETYLREQVEAAMARVLSQLPADAFHEDAHTLRDAEAVGDALTRMLKADCEPVGIEVYSAQPTGIEYAPEVAAAMQRRRIAAIDAKHRDSVLTSVVDAVDDTVNRLTARGIVELDDYERKSLVRDLTVAFYTGRSGGEGA